MNEAKYSFNIKFNLGGYDSQFTVRSDDEPGTDLLKNVPSIIAELERLGAVGERRWEQVKNGNSEKETQAKPLPKSDELPAVQDHGPTAPAILIQQARESQATGFIARDDEAPCTLCGVIGKLELIGFVRGKVHKMAWKCQACGKWLPDGTVS